MTAKAPIKPFAVTDGSEIRALQEFFNDLLGVHRAFLNDGAACIPCNYVASPLIHWIYGAIARHEMDEPAIVSRMIEKSSEYPERFDTNPFKAHWVHRADFIGWGLGAQADFDSGWHFVEATSKPPI